MAGPLGHHARLVLALLRDRKDPLLHHSVGFGDELREIALFPCEPAILIPQYTIQAMLRRGLLEPVPHEGSADRIAYQSHSAIMAEAYSPEDADRHRGTIRCWQRSYAAMVARGRPHPLHRKTDALHG